jgi:hypothetical protein
MDMQAYLETLKTCGEVIAAAHEVAGFNWGTGVISEDYHDRRIGAMNRLRDTLRQCHIISNTITTESARPEREKQP